MKPQIIIDIFDYSIAVEAPSEIDADKIERALIALGYEHASHTTSEDITGGYHSHHFTL